MLSGKPLMADATAGRNRPDVVRVLKSEALASAGFNVVAVLEGIGAKRL